MKKPKLSFWDIWNMSFGFLGIQFGFALQNANASRILQNLGADVHQLSWFWLVAPLTGMIVQPIIGHYSDNTWTRLGRRKPYFLAGALVASIGMCLMPNAAMFTALMPALFVGAGMLMIMDASFNVAMEPFRALVADKLPVDQRTLGFSIQTVLIGIGAVMGSILPYVLTNFFGVSVKADEGHVPDTVIYSFIIGATVLILAILVTVFKTPEYSPEEMAQFQDENEDAGDEVVETMKKRPFIEALVEDFKKMPTTMKQLGVVQFCSWFALFGMWVFFTPAIAQHIYDLPSTDSSSELYNKAGDWVGVLFGIYNGVSAIYAFFLPTIAKKIGRKSTYSLSLIAGGIGLISIYFMSSPNMLILSMIGVGIAWASILAMPYAILAGSIPAKKMGIYMGLFNLFITVPQITNGIIGGPMVKNIYGDQAIFALVTAGIFMIIGAISVKWVEDKDDVYAPSTQPMSGH
ncbi:MAG: MFS transporter [Saprospiraceae bacterium]|nr:MFS transporter [Saprospiraceae bacterium]